MAELGQTNAGMVLEFVSYANGRRYKGVYRGWDRPSAAVQRHCRERFQAIRSSGWLSILRLFMSSPNSSITRLSHDTILSADISEVTFARRPEQPECRTLARGLETAARALDLLLHGSRPVRLLLGAVTVPGLHTA